MNTLSRICALAAWLGLACCAFGADGGAELFEQRIRPVLVERCYSCHSAKAKTLQGGLRLDDPEALLAGGDSGPAVAPGRPQESLLLAALKYESLEMPPDGRLSPQTIADFERWIALGAPDPRSASGSGAGSGASPPADAAASHWAFQPIRRPPLPDTMHASRVRSPVDRFLLARLEDRAQTLSPRADRRTLIRRLCFDLLGLPPMVEQVAAFEADTSPDAYPRLVDRLLASPRYGERLGRHWLDVARYADNKGYVFFEEKLFPWAWTYRDYVIRAWNEDLPFDRFVLQQLAADQLDLPDRGSLAAMGFLTLGARFMNNTHDVIDDRVDVVTRGLMGLTVTCARCHDHKYDPLTQRDYYGLYGVFRSSVEPTLPPEFLPAADSEAYREFAAGMRERVEKLEQFIIAQREQIISGARSRAGEYLLAVHAKRGQPDTDNFMLLTDKGALNPTMIHRWELYLQRRQREGDPVWTAWHAFSDLPDDGFAAAAAELHARWLGPAPPQSVNAQIRQALAAGPAPQSMQDVADRYAAALADVDRQWQQLCREAEQAGQPAPAALPDEDAEALRQVLYGPQSPPMVPRQLAWGLLSLLPDRPTQEEYKKLLKEVEQWSMTQPAAPPRAMVLVDADVPYDPVVFIRGNPSRHGESVARRLPSLLNKSGEPFEQGSGRLELARAIVGADNPLTARVLANRIWMHHFGRGLVDTASDFGLRSAPPTHPELLDYLAAELIENGWSIKQLHRLILNSAAYQQQSRQSGSSLPADDPQNRLLSSFPRRRLDFESMRDTMLAVSGQLDDAMGGPPLHLLKDFVPRRTVYGFVDRMDLPGLLRAFDFPDPAATSPGREQTTVPPQALFFLNHPFTAQCAQQLLRRSDVASLDADERIVRIHQLLFARPPAAEELALGREFLAGAGEGRWVNYVHALLMTNEFLFVD